MTDPRYIAILKRTVNEQDRQIVELTTQLAIARNRIHELEHKTMFLNHTDYEIPVIDIVATEEDKL